MRKIYLLLGVCLMAIVELNAQDIIVTKNAERVESKILEVSKSEVRYKKWSDVEGPTFVLPTEDISTIMYQSGEIEVFDSKESMSPHKMSLSEQNELLVKVGGKYMYQGKTMNRKEYMSFLKDNCPVAYRQCHNGGVRAGIGAMCIGLGVVCDVAAIASLCTGDGEEGFNVLFVSSLLLDAVGIPLVITGAVSAKRSVTTFNKMCHQKEKSQANYKLNFAPNGVSFAVNF